ncbi:polysaccharide biosynthesis/export family protein [Acidicapsa acidisoli]|uniref:polysaccharide biosynthesis/export family protein n=1 Tax=Acidicapsa acidisoli TaxID=1615681 RepID=UPI0021E004A6|nr:polysaccharide biosynthesis/export family protein [Acidicapsa acidisoli]
MKLTRVLLVSLLMLPIPVWSQEPAAPDGKFVPPGLAPGDQLSVHMYDFPELASGLQVHVGADGSVHLPYAGTIPVAGMSPDQFQHAISESLQAKGIVKDPNVTVDVVTAINLSVNVIGQVATPRVIPIFAPTPLSYVIAQVGGLTGLADHHLSILHHSDQPPTAVELDPDAPSVSAMNTPVQPGDIVVVANRGVYFVGGEVLRPGIYPLGGALSVGQASPVSGEGVVKDITLMEALTQAGGVTSIAKRSKLYLLRTVDGKREEILLDQVKLSKGEIADPILHPNDIIYLQPSYLRQQTNNIFGTALSGLYAATTLREANF